MPSSIIRLADIPKRGKSIKSAYDSESFDADGTIHVDGLVGSATISPSGRDVALASPEGLAIIDLDSPWSPPRRLSSHGLPWLVVDVQWSPFAARDYWVASTANHRCLVWNLNKREDSSSGAIEHSLQAHSRAITDINFSAHHPDFLATCAVDGYVYCWDLRRPRQPALAFCDWFAGATQVKYNRQDPNIVASAHDRWLHIWDSRRAAEPIKTISAHTSKIYGIDWNRTKSTTLVTCSLDRSIKFWDYGQDDETPQRVIRTDFPVWRARHTPFGYGLLAMPQTEPGNLYLYDQRPNPDTPLDGAAEPVAVFPGHGNHKAKEFLWRSRGGVTSEGIDNREFQLVSWGEDNELRLHKVESRLLESVGYVRGTPVMKNLIITRRGATYKTFRTVDDAVPRDRRSPTMSDRPGSGGQFHSSALGLGLNARIGPWKATYMKARMNSVKHMDKTQLQIGWMKGITMSKKKSGPEVPGRAGSDDRGSFGLGYNDGLGEAEAIQDEFLRISNQLPNVKWEHIDMDSLTLRACLKGPWGVNRETIFIKVKVDIPASYPKGKAPRFYVEKTSFMPDETHRKLELELHELADRFLQRKKNCLYSAFTYLLGETDLESSTAFLRNVRGVDGDIDALADESSSEEEDENDIPAGGSASMSQELSASTELDPSATLAPAQRLAAAPPPRFCGARFSNDGRLVCFFPTKEEKARALFGVPHPDTSRERQKGEPTFAGFGRLPIDSQPKDRLRDDASGTDEQSEGSDDTESTSSTDSEPTTVQKIGLWYQPARLFRKTWSANESVRSSGGGTGAGTGTGTGTSRRRPGKPKNIISIHDLQSQLPSKRELAQEYAIFGDGADVCSHNAAVAEKYGDPDLVHVWKYAALLLRRDIPLEIHELQRRGQPVLVIARDAVARTRDVNKEGNQASTIPEADLAGRVRWGHHPLARELINDLFDYYEKVADIQMLAMLACIFGDYSIEEEAALAASHLPQPKTPLPMKAPSFSLEYFPTDPALWNLTSKSQASSAITTPRTAGTPAMYSDTPSPDENAGLIEPGSHSYSCGETPPNAPREHLRDSSKTQSLSTSPNSRIFHRSNSAVAAAFAASLPRALAGIVSGSPPDPPRKRPSPVENILSNLAPNAFAWAGSAISGAAPETPATSRTSLSDDEYWKDDLVSMVPVAVSCVPENQGLFDDDGWMSASLIDRNRHQLYSNYRYAYAEMLQMWGQPLSRLEIMKFNVLKEDNFTTSLGGGGGSTAGSNYGDPVPPPNNTTPFYPPGATSSPTSPFSDRRALLETLRTSARGGLDVSGFCRIHRTPLEPAEYLNLRHPAAAAAAAAVHMPVNGVCHRCTHVGSDGGDDLFPRTDMRCVYCWNAIVGLYAPCLACGCVWHEACLGEWLAHGGGGECASGHACNCAEEASSLHADSWASSSPAASLLLSSQERDGTGTAPSPPPPPPFADMEKRGGGRPGSGSGFGSSSARNAPAKPARSRRKSAPADASEFQFQQQQQQQTQRRGISIGGVVDSGGGGGTDTEGLDGPSGGGTTGRASASTRLGRASTAAGGGSRGAGGSSGGRGYVGSGRAHDDSDVVDGAGGRESAGQRMAVAFAGMAGGLLAGVKPPPRGDEPVSAAQLSLGKRLKRSLEEAGRPGMPRRNSGGLAMWKSSGV
ncbi:hypothetical protein VTK56DRAFT_2146 [Thermocarpiscus australiensis]